MEKIKLIKARKHHLRILWKWRNNPLIRKGCLNPEFVSLKNHKLWFFQKIKDPNIKIFIAKWKKNKIGVIRFEIKNKRVTASINLNPMFTGRHLGYSIIKAGTQKFLRATKNKKSVSAIIKKSNIASIKAFIKAGYVFKKVDNENLIYQYQNTLN